MQSALDDLTCVCLAPTGMIPQKHHNPSVPIAPSEIIEVVLSAAEQGLTYAHIHARKPDGTPTSETDRYAEIISGIRKYNRDLVLCVSLSGRLDPDPAVRTQPIQLSGELKPDMGSLTLSSLNFLTQASVNTPTTIEYLAKEMLDKGIKPELEVFDLGMLNFAKVLLRRKLIVPPLYINVLLGNIASAQLSAPELGAMIAMLPQGSIWSLAGIGDTQLSATAVAIALNAGVRIGLEDSIWYDRKRKVPATNGTLLQRTLDLLDIHERKPMPPQRFRQLINLQPGQGLYGALP